MRTTINDDNAVTPSQLIGLVDSHGLTISWERMTRGYVGAVDLRTGTIFLDHSLDGRPRALISTIAHELGHIALCHGCMQDRRGEDLADEWAARLLVRPTMFASAEYMYGENDYEIARELGVTQRIVKAYRRALHSLVA